MLHVNTYHVMAFVFSLKFAKIKHIHFRFFFKLRIDHVLFPRNAPRSKSLKCPTFGLIWENEHFKIFEHFKVSHFEEKACDHFEN